MSQPEVHGGFADESDWRPVGICGSCVHYYPDEPGCCDAFPSGIPVIIQTGEYDHHRPYPGDGGTTYEEHT